MHHFTQDDQRLYVIGPANDYQLVKIGISVDPIRRLLTMQTGFPYDLRLWDEYNGGRSFESVLHGEFERFCIRGEWFDFGLLDPRAEIARVAQRFGFQRHADERPVVLALSDLIGDDRLSNYTFGADSAQLSRPNTLPNVCRPASTPMRRPIQPKPERCERCNKPTTRCRCPRPKATDPRVVATFGKRCE